MTQSDNMFNKEQYCSNCGQSDGWTWVHSQKICKYCTPTQMPQKQYIQQPQQVIQQPQQVIQRSAVTTIQPNTSSKIVPLPIVISSFIAGICLLFTPVVTAKIRYFTSYDWGSNTYVYDWSYGCFDHIILGLVLGPSGLLMCQISWKSFQANKGKQKPPTSKFIRGVSIFSIIMVIVGVGFVGTIAEEELSPGESVDGSMPGGGGIVTILCCITLLATSSKIRIETKNVIYENS